MHIYKSQFFHVFIHSKSSCLGTLKFHIVNLTVILWYCNCLADLKLCYFLKQIRQNDIFCRFFIFILHILRSFPRSQIKIVIVKFRLLSRKTLISWIFFPYIYVFSNIDYPIFGNLNKVVGIILTSSIPLSYLTL